MSFTCVENFSHGLSHFRWIIYDLDSVGLETCDFTLGISLSSGNDSTSVTHSSSWGSSLTGDETNNRKTSLIVLRKPLGCLFFSFSTDFTNHDYTFSLWVDNETAQNVNEVGTVEWISTDANYG